MEKMEKRNWLLRLETPPFSGIILQQGGCISRESVPGTGWAPGGGKRPPSRCTKHVKQDWENWEDALGKTDDGSDRAMAVSPFFLQLKRDFWSINMTNNGERCRVRTESHLVIQPIFWKMRGTIFWIFVLIQKEAPWSFRFPWKYHSPLKIGRAPKENSCSNRPFSGANCDFS